MTERTNEPPPIQSLQTCKEAVRQANKKRSNNILPNDNQTDRQADSCFKLYICAAYSLLSLTHCLIRCSKYVRQSKNPLFRTKYYSRTVFGWEITELIEQMRLCGYLTRRITCLIVVIWRNILSSTSISVNELITAILLFLSLACLLVLLTSTNKHSSLSLNHSQLRWSTTLSRSTNTSQSTLNLVSIFWGMSIEPVR